MQKLNSNLLLTYFIVMLSFTGALFSNNTVANESVTSQQMFEKALKEHQGDVIYVDFWASWCGPCRKSFPWMNSIQAKYKEQGFTVISINLDAEKSLALKFLHELPATFPVVYDPKGKLARKFNVKGMPSSMILDRDGAIQYSHAGFHTKKIPDYEQEIMQLLKKSRGSHE